VELETFKNVTGPGKQAALASKSPRLPCAPRVFSLAVAADAPSHVAHPPSEIRDAGGKVIP
jgi:hypothetical protein